MSKTLIVMRHAKSSWGDHGLADIERPLNARGIASAKAIGEWLRFGKFEPSLALISNSRRTSQTWEEMGLSAETQFLPELYHAAAETILRVLRGASGDCVLVLGHNPGIGDFAARILGVAPSHDRFADYPTGATLVATVQSEWSDLDWHSATTRAFTVPRDLM
ncbi:SixA phosphatase family protein [Shimia ponticola]|uniref:SixA phosphatase family protein n=1 Tax=Shimia ponticola TaxID=2582893 RepID=UPI0011BD875E|nr:histidine phosphatase family protein [Shimia ponticola]